MKRKKILSFAMAVAMSFGSITGFCHALEPEMCEDYESSAYIVVLDAPALLSPDRPSVYGDDGESYKEAYRSALLDLQNEIKMQFLSQKPMVMSLDDDFVSYSYTDVLNGFTISATKEEAQQIAKIDGVASVVKNEMLCADFGNQAYGTEEASTTASNNISALNSSALIEAPDLHQKGLNGEGRAIAVIDTTIEPTHSYFALSDGVAQKYTSDDISRIISGGSLNVKNATGVYRSSKIPFAYNYANGSNLNHSNKHGIHVSGIAAGNSYTRLSSDEGNGIVTGVAPEAQILFMGVFNSAGTASYDTVLAALDDAVKFDIDAINLSLGANYISENYQSEIHNHLRTSLANAQNAGIAVVYAAGNSGHDGSQTPSVADYSISDNSTCPTSIKVASVQGNYALLYYVEDENGNKYPCVPLVSGKTFDFTQFADCKDGSSGSFADASGKVAVITMPHKIYGKTFAACVSDAVAAGAVAVVIINDVNQILSGSVSSTVPVVYMPYEAGAALLECGTKIKYASSLKALKIHNAPIASESSSYAVTDSLRIGVDVAAPGGHILSSLGNGSMGVMSGTSMAAPHITGAISLLYDHIESEFAKVSGKDKVELARQLICSTAKSVYEENGVLASTRQVGAGIAQLDKAISTKVVVTDDSGNYANISLGDKIDNSFNISFKVKNLSDSAVNFDKVSVELSTDDYKYYSDLGRYGYRGLRSPKFTLSEVPGVSVDANSEKVVTLAVELDSAEMAELSSVMTNGFFIDGKVSLSSSAGDNCDVGIAFTGFRGNWSSQDVIAKSSFYTKAYLWAADAIGGYSYCSPEKDGNKYALYLSSTPSVDILDSTVYLIVTTARNAYASVSRGETELCKEVFCQKNHETMVPVSTLRRLVSASGDVSVRFRLPYDEKGEYSQIIGLSVIEDNQRPAVTIKVTSSSSDVTSSVECSDNKGVTTVRIKGVNASGETVGALKEVDVLSGETVFGIPGVSNIDYFVYDRAFNCTSIIHSVRIVEEDGVIKIKNGDSSAVNGTLIIAKYDDKTLLSVETVGEDGFALDAFEESTINTKDYENGDYKIFYWTDIDGLTPISIAYNNQKN